MIKLTNTTNQEIVLVNHLFRESGTGDESYTIPELDLPSWANDDEVIQNISNGNIDLESNGVAAVSINDAINILKGLSPKLVDSTPQAFASKRLTDGSRIFRRIRSSTGSVQNQPENIDFEIPFTKCKITGVQILGGKLGDKATFQILDTDQGTISGTPNKVLNEFGKDVYIIPDVASYPSKYDADLIAGLTLRIIYDAKDELLPRSIYINYDLHEVKD